MRKQTFGSTWHFQLLASALAGFDTCKLKSWEIAFRLMVVVSLISKVEWLNIAALAIAVALLVYEYGYRQSRNNGPIANA